MTRRTLDVSGLPSYAFGARAPLWWALMLMVAIEGTMLALLALSYFYVRDRLSPFPPVSISRTAAWIATAEMAIWVASVVPTMLQARAARRESLDGMRLWLGLATLLGAVAAVLRWYEFHLLPFRWDDTAYGSIVWTLLGLQWVHQLTGVGENLLMEAVLFKGPVEKHHCVDVEVTTPLWYFVVSGAVLCWLVVFLPWVIR